MVVGGFFNRHMLDLRRLDCSFYVEIFGYYVDHVSPCLEIQDVRTSDSYCVIPWWRNHLQILHAEQHNSPDAPSSLGHHLA